MKRHNHYFRNVESAIAFGDVGERSLLDFGSAIAFGDVGVWGCDSEALRRNRFLRMLGERSLFGIGNARLKLVVCDRFWRVWKSDLINFSTMTNSNNND